MSRNNNVAAKIKANLGDLCNDEYTVKEKFIVVTIKSSMNKVPLLLLEIFEATYNLLFSSLKISNISSNCAFTNLTPQL